MCAGAYQKSESARCCNGGPEALSITSEGWEGDWTAKKKSGPRPAQAVPSFRSLASKLAAIASCRPPMLDFARSISCRADFFSVANAFFTFAAVAGDAQMPPVCASSTQALAPGAPLLFAGTESNNVAVITMDSGNVTAAAKKLGISRRTLHRKINEMKAAGESI